MRSLSIHPLSLALGLGLGAVCLLSMSQVWPAGQHVLVSYGPDPRDMVQIREGTPYVVPVGRVLVVTALGSSEGIGGASSGAPCALKVNGQTEVSAATVDYVSGGSGAAGNVASLSGLPVGFTVPSGSVVEPFYSWSVGTGRAWGYLAPQ